jgi:regulator of CtrA degradation
MPKAAKGLIEASTELYRRVERLDTAQSDEEVSASPARSMFERLAMAF